MKQNRILIPIHKRPNPYTTLLRAACGISMRYSTGMDTPAIRAEWDDVKIDRAHLDEFAAICGLPFHSGFECGMPVEKEHVYPLYPLTLVFPLVMRVLGHGKAPLTVFRTLNTKLKVVGLRRIGVHERLRISSETRPVRVAPKGLEMDVHSVIRSDNETVWESVHTFYYRGKFGSTNGADVNQTMLSALSDTDLLASWYLADGIGFRFGLISGDTNGIHYSSLYAKLFGFERDLAQPILALSKCLDALLEGEPPAFSLTALLKGPVYYESNVSIKGRVEETGRRFDVYCEDNPKPSLCCEITY